LSELRKDDAEKKRLEAHAKKKEREDMLAEENKTIASKQTRVNPVKVTQAQIREEQAKREEAARGKVAAKPEPVTHLTIPLQENINRCGVA